MVRVARVSALRKVLTMRPQGRRGEDCFSASQLTASAIAAIWRQLEQKDGDGPHTEFKSKVTPTTIEGDRALVDRPSTFDFGK
jgi:hypothetical protein